MGEGLRDRLSRMLLLRRKGRSLGETGEALAAQYLKNQGYRILARNLRVRRKEIDLIVQKGDIIAFVEVRTRASAEPIAPQDTVNRRKQTHLIHAARECLMRNRQEGVSYRFDIVAIVLPEGGDAEITHFPDAFRMRE